MIERRVLGSLGTNCYLIVDETTLKAAIIDPDGSAKYIYNWVKEKGVEVEYILLTHGHADHIGAVAELKQLLNAKVAIHSDDAEMLENPYTNLSAFMGRPLSAKADLLLEDGQVIKLGNKEIKVIATPGHTPGGVSFVIDEGVVSGDTLFYGSIGRTDFPGGSLSTLLQSIKSKLFSFPDETKVYPGHGEETTIGFEKRVNPFLS